MAHHTAPLVGPPLDVVILAGGTASRLGGVSKPDVLLSGDRLLDRVIDAVRDALSGVPGGVQGGVQDAPPALTLVGPETLEREGCRVVREDPVHGGPAAGLSAALPGLTGEWVVVLSCDLENPAAALDALRAGHDPADNRDGTVLCDPEGRPQWLIGMYRRVALECVFPAPDQDSAADPAPVDGLSLRHTVGRLALHRHAATADAIADIDTPDALRAAHARRGWASPPPTTTTKGPQ